MLIEWRFLPAIILPGGIEQHRYRFFVLGCNRVESRIAVCKQYDVDFMKGVVFYDERTIFDKNAG